MMAAVDDNQSEYLAINGSFFFSILIAFNNILTYYNIQILTGAEVNTEKLCPEVV